MGMLTIPIGDHDLEEARAEHGHDPDRQEQARDREHHVHAAHDHGVGLPAEVAGDPAEDQADGQADDDRDDPDHQRVAGAVDDPRPLVARLLVETRPVVGRGPLERVRERRDHVPRAVRRDQGGEDGHDQEAADENESDDRARVAADPAESVAPEALRGLLENLAAFELGDRHQLIRILGLMNP